MGALVSVDARLFDLSKVVLLVGTVGCYQFPFTVPAMSQTLGDLLVEGGHSPLQDLLSMLPILVHCACGVPDIGQSVRQGWRFPLGRLS